MASTSETTPLLANPEPLTDGEQIPQEEVTTTSTHEKPPYYRTIVVLTHLSAAFSLVAFVFDLAGLCIDAFSQNGFYLFWGLRTYVQGLLALSILSTITSSINLARLRHARAPLWLVVNLFLDGIIVYYAIFLGPEALGRDLDQVPDSWLPNKRIVATAKAAIAILGIGIVAGLLVGLIHVILFLLRCYAAFVTGSWRTWRVPGGEFKFEVSVKFLRQGKEGREDAPEVDA